MRRQLNSKGVLEVRPDFNSERLPYRIETRHHDIYEYVLEHCSPPIDDDKRIKDQLLQMGAVPSPRCPPSPPQS